MLNVGHSILRGEGEGDVFALRRWRGSNEESNSDGDLTESPVE